MKRGFLLIALLLLWAMPAVALDSAQGWCEEGGQTVTLSGLVSTTKVQQSFPSCTVTVYLTGTSTLATIYSDNAGSPTPLANPFTATTLGHWQFYSANGVYDVVLGFASPFTLTAVSIGGGAGLTGSAGQVSFFTGAQSLGGTPTFTWNTTTGTVSAPNVGATTTVTVGTSFPDGTGSSLDIAYGIRGPGMAFSQFIGTSTPVLSPSGGDTLAAFGSALKVGTTYHMYYMDGISTISHATSADGKTWTKDAEHNPVFRAGTGGNWDSAQVGTPNVWVEGAVWYMLYRGQNGGYYRAGLATSSDGLTWTRAAVNNCTVTGNGCVIDNSFTSGGALVDIEPYGVIKVGSTYYVSIDQPGGSFRSLGIATSTNLTTWTRDSLNPLFVNGRYCAGWFKLGAFYYLMVNHYLAGGTTYSEIELYRDSLPTFHADHREYLGIIKSPSYSGWDAYGLDTPIILTDDITRSTFAASGGDLWMYYAGSSTAAHTLFYTGLAIAFQQSSITLPHQAMFPDGLITLGNFTGGGQGAFQGGSTTTGGMAIGSSGLSYGDVGYNITHSATSDVYNYTMSGETASMLRFSNGGFQFRGTASTGTAGNPVTFTDFLNVSNTGLIAAINTASISYASGSTLGDSRSIKLIETSGGVNTRKEIGFGYVTTNKTYQPVVIGSKVTDNAAETAGTFYVATRALTTDSAPIERFTITAAGDATFTGIVAVGNTLNTVNPTSPNRTITMVVGGVTVYIAAKTTND